MLFKILHGDESNISLDVTPFHEGWAYVTHSGFFYVDLNVGTAASPNNQRLKLNAKEAEKLVGYDIATILNSSDVEIPTSKAVLTALAGKSDNGHKHAVADVTGIQDALNAKANTSHGTHVTYSTTAPVMDGTAAVGTATTVARSDHKHPTDTSRASKADLDTLSERVDGKSDIGHNHEIADVSGLQSALDNKAAKSHGTHVTYATTAPKMDGTAAVGTASNVARGDHVHPTDTSRASQADLDALSDVVDGKAPATHNHTIAANASDDDVVVLAGTSGTNGVTYSASHANSGVTAGTYKSVTVNAKGHVTGGSNPTTLAGYGITDAATKSSVETLATQVAGKANASHGNHVPAVETANNAKFLRNDNTWQTVTPANIGAAATTHKHAAGDITSGTLPITRGGTGATTAENALKNLGIYIGPTEPTDPNIKIWINTSEEGTGAVPVLPRIATITLKASAWTGTAAPYKQAVTINTVTSATKVDLQPTASQLTALQQADISLMAENTNGSVYVYAFGGKPSSDMSMQVMLTEVAYV
jgi:hypothetical protein